MHERKARTSRSCQPPPPFSPSRPGRVVMSCWLVGARPTTMASQGIRPSYPALQLHSCFTLSVVLNFMKCVEIRISRQKTKERERVKHHSHNRGIKSRFEEIAREGCSRTKAFLVSRNAFYTSTLLCYTTPKRFYAHKRF